MDTHKKHPAPKRIARLIAGAVFAGVFLCMAIGCANEPKPDLLPDGQPNYAGFFEAQLSPLDVFAREAFIYRWVGKQPAKQYPEIFRQTQALEPTPRQQVRAALVRAWANTDPAAAWQQWLAEASDDTATGDILACAWAEKNFEAAWAAATDANPPPHARPARALLAMRARNNPEDALALALSLPEDRIPPALEKVLQVWGETAPEAAVQWALKNSRLYQLRPLFADWLLRDFDASCQSLDKMDADTMEALAGRIPYGDFALVSPQTAWALIDHCRPRTKDNGYGLTYLASAWLAKATPKETLRRAAEFPDMDMRRDMLGNNTLSLGYTDGAAAFAYLQETMPLLDQAQRKKLLDDRMPRIAERAPLLALPFILQSPAPDADKWLWRALDSLKDSEIEQAIVLVENRKNIPKPGYHNRCTFLEKFYQTRPEQATAWLANIADADTKETLSTTLVRMLIKTDPAAAASLYKALSPSGKLRLYADDFANMNADDPRAALEWAQTSFSDGTQKTAIAGIIAKLAETDMAAALELAASLPEQTAEGIYWGSIVANASPANRMRMLECFGTFAVEPYPKTLVRTLLDALGAIDAQALAEALRDPVLFDRVFTAQENERRMNLKDAIERAPEAFETLEAALTPERAHFITAQRSVVLAQTDPTAAMTLAQTLPQNLEYQRVWEDVFNKWRSWQPAQALQWLCAQKDIPKISDPYGEGLPYHLTMRAWAESDETSAERWLKTQPEGPRKDAMIMGLIEALRQYNAPSAFEWALQISDEHQRKRYARIVLHLWQTYNAPEALEAQKRFDALFGSDSPSPNVIYWVQ